MSCFFFQAEDGIRDYKVTGVQTCALPIFHRFGTTSSGAVHYFADSTAPGGIGDHRQFVASGSATGVGDVVLRAKGTMIRERSEERRVGKEGGGGWGRGACESKKGAEWRDV